MNQVEDQLSVMGRGNREIQTYLAPLKNLINDELFWQEKSNGLALFLDENELRIIRLTVQVEELALVGDTFHITPLIPIYNGNGQFFLLSIAKKRPKLFMGSKFRLEQVEEMNLPESLQKMFDEFFEVHDHLNFHTKSTSPNSDFPGGRDGMHFGQGGNNIDEKAEIRNFFHLFDEALMAYLSTEVAPLVLAGVGLLHPIYKEANTYPYLVEEGITKDVSHMSEEELHKIAWEIVSNKYKMDVGKALGVYQSLEDKNGDTTDDLETIVSGAFFKQVYSLFFAENVHAWGAFDSNKNEVSIEDKPTATNQDLLNLAAVHTVVNGGEVLVIPQENMPGKSKAAAILRY